MASVAGVFIVAKCRRREKQRGNGGNYRASYHDDPQRSPEQVRGTIAVTRQSVKGRNRPQGPRMRPAGTAVDAGLDLPLDHLQLELGDGFRGVEALRARLGAVHDGVAAVEPERILEIVEPLAGGFIPGILEPARR